MTASKTPKQRATRNRRSEKKVGIDVFEELLNLMRDVVKTNDREGLERVGFQLLPYIRPRLRSTEVSGNIDADVVVRIVLGED